MQSENLQGKSSKSNTNPFRCFPVAEGVSEMMQVIDEQSSQQNPAKSQQLGQKISAFEKGISEQLESNKSKNKGGLTKKQKKEDTPELEVALRCVIWTMFKKMKQTGPIGPIRKLYSDTLLEVKQMFPILSEVT